jgi:Domain of unknown function (DUF5666)
MPQRYFLAAARLYRGVRTNGAFGGRLMRSNMLKIAAVLTIVLSLLPVGAARAAHENEIKFTGVVESMPSSGRAGDYKVAGRIVHATTSTRIEEEDGRLAVGATVKVEGTQRADGSVDATEIEVKQGASGGGNSGPGNGGGNGGDDRGQGEVKFKGTITSLPGTAGFVGDWVIGGRTVHVTASTRIETEGGPVATGAFAEVEGAQLPDGSMSATKIEIESNVAGGDGRDELHGVIQQVPAGIIGDWVVSGRTVHVTASTFIDQEHGAVVVGALVEVNGVLQPDGSINATKIEVKVGADESGRSGNFKGTIQNLPASADLTGDWTISGRTVHVISTTQLKGEHGRFVVGARVKVKGMSMADGSVVATRVQARD